MWKSLVKAGRRVSSSTKELRCDEGIAPYGYEYAGVEGITGNVDMNAAYKDYPAIIKAAGLNSLKKEVKPWYADAQAWVVEKGISDGTKHNTPVTRAELWDALYRAFGK